MTETRWFEAHDRHCLSPMIELITTLRFVLINIFLSQRRKLHDLKHMIGVAFNQWKNWSPLFDMCWSRFSRVKDGNSDLKHMIGIAFHQWKNWSPHYDMCWSIFSFLKIRKLDDLKHMIGIAFHEWKNWSPLYDLCWTRFSDQDFPWSQRRNLYRWFSLERRTWFEAALPFTNERTDHHFTICADQDFRFSKTETRWFEAHDRRCLSPLKELITTLQYVLIKIFLSQRRKLDDLKHMIGIAFHQR